MVVDLTLDGLRYPALENFLPPFGKKEASGGVSTEGVCQDVMLPFSKQRPIEIFENATTKADAVKGDVQADSKLIFTGANLTFALGTPATPGIKVEVMAGFTGSGTSEVSFSGASGATTVALQANKSILLVANAALEWEEVGKFYGATQIAASASIVGPSLSVGDEVKVMFTQSVAGTDGTTGLALEYNGASVPVMAHQNGSLVSVTAKQISSGNWRYLDAYTTLQLIYDGTNFVIVGNPVVLSSSDYTIYADGQYRNVLNNKQQNINGYMWVS